MLDRAPSKASQHDSLLWNQGIEGINVPAGKISSLICPQPNNVTTNAVPFCLLGTLPAALDEERHSLIDKGTSLNKEREQLLANTVNSLGTNKRAIRRKFEKIRFYKAFKQASRPTFSMRLEDSSTGVESAPYSGRNSRHPRPLFPTGESASQDFQGEDILNLDSTSQNQSLLTTFELTQPPSLVKSRAFLRCTPVSMPHCRLHLCRADSQSRSRHQQGQTKRASPPIQLPRFSRLF
jgi:hypothetical protein